MKYYEALGSKQSWYSRWLLKHSATSRTQNFYQNLAMWLKDNGILKLVGEKSKTSRTQSNRYVLDESILNYTQEVIAYQCNECYSKTTIPQYLKKSFNNVFCQQRFCNGKYIKTEQEKISNYFDRYFSVEGMRINASEHTGSLDIKIKKIVEEEFKKNNSITPYHDINFLSCTPTLELGIDIGNLSSVILKSVPRNAASFVQRIGRSGRTTGNSLDILVLEKKSS